jgi:hypothetical protein
VQCGPFRTAYPRLHVACAINAFLLRFQANDKTSCRAAKWLRVVQNQNAEIADVTGFKHFIYCTWDNDINQTNRLAISTSDDQGVEKAAVLLSTAHLDLPHMPNLSNYGFPLPHGHTFLSK